jgi:hypothetical protein
MRLDLVSKLRNYLQVAAFCLAIPAIQVAFVPDRPYAPGVAYSLMIGSITWAIVDLGRHAFPSAQETGWPQGPAGIALVGVGMVAGFFGGSAIADFLCLAFGWYPVGRVRDPREPIHDVLISAIAGTIGIFYFYSVNKSQYLERKMGEARRHADEARLKLLETQLEPHMLFNTLANLRALIGVDPQRAQAMLDHMIAYLRATLAASRTTTHPLGKEFERLNDYLELMAIRMGPRLSFSLLLPDELAQQPVPTLLLQPLVENSIQHGLEPKVEGGQITVSARAEAGELVLEVADTGVGGAPSPATGKGFGLQQIRERLATLYGTAGAIDFVAAHASGARATVRFPLKHG